MSFLLLKEEESTDLSSCRTGVGCHEVIFSALNLTDCVLLLLLCVVECGV